MDDLSSEVSGTKLFAHSFSLGAYRYAPYFAANKNATVVAHHAHRNAPRAPAWAFARPQERSHRTSLLSH